MDNPYDEQAKYYEERECVLQEKLDFANQRIAELEAQLEKNVEARWDANREIVRLEDALHRIVKYGTDPGGNSVSIAKAALKGGGDEYTSLPKT